MFCQLVVVMVYCYKEYIVYRDFKCENILFDGEGKLKVIGEVLIFIYVYENDFL